MSNRVRPREMNGGKLTRPRAQWRGHSRRTARSPLAGEMNRITATLAKTMMRSVVFPKVTLPRRKGDA